LRALQRGLALLLRQPNRMDRATSTPA